MAVLAAVAALAVARIEEPLRRTLETRINAALDGYTVSIGRLDLHVLGFAVELVDVSVVQDMRPRPPVVYIPSWTTSIEWRALLSLALVADAIFTRPTVFITIDQAAQESRDRVQVSDRGWQDALAAVYPLEVNTLRVVDGEVSYYDRGNLPPLRLEHLYFRATNIRNVLSAPGRNPSPVEFTCTVFETGRLTASGHADFLAKPYPTLVADFDLDDARLLPLAPMARRWDLTVLEGAITAAGRLAHTTEHTAVTLRRLVVSNPSLEYARPGAHEQRPVEQAVRSAVQAAAEPTFRVDVDDMRVRGGTLAVKLDALRSADGKTVYAEARDLPPLRLEQLDLHVTGVRSHRVEPDAPTRFELRCMLPGGGRLDASGRADLLATPTPTLAADVALRDVTLEPWAPLARRWAIAVSGGALAGAGTVTVESRQTAVVVRRIAVSNPMVEYVQATATDERRLERATRAATDAEPDPTFRLDVQDARIRNGTFGFVDRTADPPYHLALTRADVSVRGFSNQMSRRRGTASLRGRFMESGGATIDATFASGTRQAEFDMGISLEGVQLVELNDLLRARGGFDVAAGRFSFYSEIAAQDGRVQGYVKPFFENLDVYDRRQDARKGVGKQMYEALVGAAGTVLENRPQDQVATRADLSGPIENPDASTWQIVLNLLRNAFWRGLLPGLDEARGRS